MVTFFMLNPTAGRSMEMFYMSCACASIDVHVKMVIISYILKILFTQDWFKSENTREAIYTLVAALLVSLVEVVVAIIGSVYCCKRACCTSSSANSHVHVVSIFACKSLTQ